MDFFIYIIAAIIGTILGFLGGGGSILTLPILLFFKGIGIDLATAYSLFIVGIASSFGALIKIRKKEISIKTAIIFSIPSFIVVFLCRLFIVPNIPPIISLGFFEVSKFNLILFLFALIMLISSISMIKGTLRAKKNGTQKEINHDEEATYNYPLIIFEGIIVGLISGLLGIGGGFLIIPALVVFARIPMKLAIGTSLFIISLKSMIGFAGDVVAGQNIDWNFLLSFSFITLIGVMLGTYLSKFFSNKHLRALFGWFVFTMSVLIFIVVLFDFEHLFGTGTGN